MQQNLRPFERLVRLVLGVFLLFAAAYFFHNVYARIFIVAISIFSFGEALTARCLLMSRLGMKTQSELTKPEIHYLVGLAFIQLAIAYEWWVAGFEKIVNPEFAQKLPGTLAFFASKNPFPWVQGYLLGPATQNAQLLGQLVQWGELIAAIALGLGCAMMLYTKRAGTQWFAGAISIFALLTGALLNAIFYIAAGWTSPSTSGINMLMFWVQLLLAYTWLMRMVRAK